METHSQYNNISRRCYFCCYHYHYRVTQIIIEQVAPRKTAVVIEGSLYFSHPFNGSGIELITLSLCSFTPVLIIRSALTTIVVGGPDGRFLIVIGAGLVAPVVV